MLLYECVFFFQKMKKNAEALSKYHFKVRVKYKINKGTKALNRKKIYIYILITKTINFDPIPRDIRTNKTNVVAKAPNKLNLKIEGPNSLAKHLTS